MAPAPPAAATLEKLRQDRESRWMDALALEDAVLEPYLEFEKLSDAEWLRRLEEKAQTVLRTNVQLQGQLREQDHVLQELRGLQAARQEQHKELQAELLEAKARQGQAEAKSREVREHCVAEERRLRERGGALRERMAALARENAQLEDGRRQEERHAARHRALLVELKRQTAGLVERRAELEGPSETASDLGSLSASRAGARESPTSRCSSSLSSHGERGTAACSSREALRSRGSRTMEAESPAPGGPAGAAGALIPRAPSGPRAGGPRRARTAQTPEVPAA
mmetsp:Transcript_28447/g.90637  ORF Transcript_28447/g.90637 Transcript_28447/m.90637 type:complete len:283 (+) Transcript_28447:87-935(+)